MAYTPNIWVDREGTTRYFETVDNDGALIFTPDYTQVTEMGTPVNADNMNHIEEGIAAGSFTKYDSMATYAKNDLVTTIVDNELKVYKSLQDNNTNALDNASFWEEVEFSGGGGTGLQMFDTILKDHVLTYEETKGLALQGTYVYKEALAGSRYGYPDFYNKCIQERNTATATQVTLGDSTITMYVASNGHQYYDIANKDVVDTFFGTMGTAWFYGVDTANERIFLPRNNYFDQATGDTTEVGQSVEAGLPNITGTIEPYKGFYSATYTGAFYDIGSTGQVASGATDTARKYGFDASLSNPIYGNSDTVQPNAVKKLLYICVGNTTNYEGVSEVVNQGMEILEQINEGFVSKDSMVELPIMTMPDYENSIYYGESSFTAPADGWFSFAMQSNNNRNVYLDGREIARSGGSASSQYVGFMFPIAKGSVVTSTVYAGLYVTFYPMKGVN